MSSNIGVGASDPNRDEVPPYLRCLYCRENVPFPGKENVEDYQHHLFERHNILYGKEEVIKITLNRQFPPKKDTTDVSIQAERVQAPPLNSATNRIRAREDPMLAPNQCDTSGEEEVPMDEDDPDDPPEMDCPAIVDADGDNLGYMDKGGTEDSDKKELTMVERMISWYEGCEYQCQICMEMFFVSDYLRLHIKNSHKMTSDDYIDKHDQLESKSMTISCKICNHVMKRNLFAINKHVESQHNMDVIRYGKKFRLPKYKVNYLGYPSKEEGAIAADPDGEEAAAPVKRPSLVLGNKPGPKSKKAKISGPKPIPAKVVKHLRWFEGSEYGCRICSDVLFSEEDLKDHLKEKHSSMAKSYLDKQKESLITQERLYKCQVCDEDVNHTMDHITSHLRDEHCDMELSVYEMIYESTETREVYVSLLQISAEESYA